MKKSVNVLSVNQSWIDKSKKTQNNILNFKGEKIKFNPDKKFDIQLSASLIAERKLGDLFTSAKLERVDLSPECWKIEQKTESWLWERTGNLCIEYRNRGKLSGIASTETDFWIHELKRDDDTLVYIMIPVPDRKSTRLNSSH